MFISARRCGYIGTDQITSGRFLILCQPESDNVSETCNAPLRALVRFTSLRQCGHFMMGNARAFGHKITLSGAYGNDGLPCTVPRAVYNRAVPVPAEIVEAWNKGGGWNDAGSETNAMRAWAKTL